LEGEFIAIQFGAFHKHPFASGLSIMLLLMKKCNPYLEKDAFIYDFINIIKVWQGQLHNLCCDNISFV